MKVIAHLDGGVLRDLWEDAPENRKQLSQNMGKDYHVLPQEILEELDLEGIWEKNYTELIIAELHKTVN